MFTRIFLLTVAFISLFFFSFTNKQKKKSGLFVDEKWNKVSRLAKEKDKPIFIYFGASACKSCKRMDRVFKDKELSDSLQANFICKKMDVQKVFNNMKANSWGITSIPAYVFMNKSGEIIYKSNGVKNVGQMKIEAGNALLVMKHAKSN